MDCSLPGSSVHGILQAGILGCVAIPLSRRSSWPWDWTQVSCIAGRFFKECNARDLGSIPGSEGSPGERKGYPLQWFWPGEFHGLYSPWGCKESDTTEWLSLHSPSLPSKPPGNLTIGKAVFVFCVSCIPMHNLNELSFSCSYAPTFSVHPPHTHI